MYAELYHGDPLTIDYTPSGAVAAGDVVVINGQPYIAELDIAAGRPGALSMPNGGAVYKVAKATGARSAGVLLYWDVADNNLNTDTGNPFFGVVTADAASGDATAYVQHLPLTAASTVTVQGDLRTALTDPGNAGAIPVTVTGYVPIVTTGSETRTLAIPTFIGQELLLYVKTDGGTCVITVASAINQTGNNTITMADVRDSIRLQAIESGSNKVWDVVETNGAALSTV